MSIDTDTPLLPLLIAETVVQQLAAYLNEELPATYAPRLAEYAETIYANNVSFRKKLRGRGDTGRDALYVFMRHWLTSFIQKDSHALYQRLPDDFWKGAEPVIARQTEVKPCAHRFEVGSPVDTVETCVHCGATASCEPLCNQWPS